MWCYLHARTILTTLEDVDDLKKKCTEGTACISIGEDRADGVGILFKYEVEIIKSRKIIPGRILMVDTWVRLINVYTPPDRAGKMGIFFKLQEITISI